MRLESHSPCTTTRGAMFIGVAGWTLTVEGNATVLDAPAPGARIVLFDVDAFDPDAAIAAAGLDPVASTDTLLPRDYVYPGR